MFELDESEGKDMFREKWNYFKNCWEFYIDNTLVCTCDESEYHETLKEVENMAA